MKTVTILGATGSVGRSTADLIMDHPDRFNVQAVTANTNADGLADLAIKLRAKLAVVGERDALDQLRQRLVGTGIECNAGADAIREAASMPADYVMAAIVGMAGLRPLLEAIKQGTIVAIANKEPLVAAGSLVMEAAASSGARLLPVDSEHNAVFQVLDPVQKASVRRIVLTASGGPVRTLDAAKLHHVTREQAIAHPNWAMGRKISVDSATMMNKALEIIEACCLFGLPADKVDVIIHPQSAVHGMVEYIDGSILTQMGPPDMRVPIASTLAWPTRIDVPAARLDLLALGRMDFLPVDHDRFPAIRLAYDCIAAGPSACIAMNAANEIAVREFLDGRLGFMEIVETVRAVVETIPRAAVKTLEEIIGFDETVRRMTTERIDAMHGKAA